MVYQVGMQGTGGVRGIYCWSATQIRVQLTVTSTGACDGMRVMGQSKYISKLVWYASAKSSIQYNYMINYYCNNISLQNFTTPD